MNAEQLVEALGLVPLEVEGGLYRQTFVAEESLSAEVLPARYGGAKPMSTLIYYLLTDDLDSFSALHRLPTDEVYHFYLGDPVEMLQLHPDGSSDRVVLGSDVLGGQRVQYVAARDVWQGSRLLAGGRFALMGTTMAPGFTEGDYEGGEREALMELYPADVELIRALTRPEAPLRLS